MRSSNTRDGTARGPAGTSTVGTLSKAAISVDSRLTYGGSLAGRLRNAAAPRWYSPSAAMRAGRVATESAFGWARSVYTAGLSGPTDTVQTPTGFTPTRFRAGTRAVF